MFTLSSHPSPVTHWQNRAVSRISESKTTQNLNALQLYYFWDGNMLPSSPTPETLRGMLNQIMLLLSRQKNSLRPPFLINTNISLLIKKYKKVFFLLAPTEERKKQMKKFQQTCKRVTLCPREFHNVFFLFGAITSSWLPWNKFQDYDMSWRRTQLCWSVKPIIKWNLLRKKDVNIFWPFSVSVPKNLSQFFN